MRAPDIVAAAMPILFAREIGLHALVHLMYRLPQSNFHSRLGDDGSPPVRCAEVAGD